MDEMRSRTKFLLLFSILTTISAPLLLSYIIPVFNPVVILLLLIYIFSSAILYQRYILGRKPEYPYGVYDPDDISFPRSNLPRPIYKDIREHPEYFKTRNKKKKED